MKYSTAKSFRRALEERLRLLSKKENIDLQRLRKQVAFDRLLTRLFAEPYPPWVLKGGYAMELRLREARSTRDIDLIMEKSEKAILERLQQAAAVENKDFFVFFIGDPVRSLDAAPYGGGRYPVETRMDGHIFSLFHLDLAIGDVIMEPLDVVEGRDWLKFAGIPSISFPAISQEQQFAEKLHAYTIPRRRPNSRVRDIVDMILLIKMEKMDKTKIKHALTLTFNRRKTHTIPEALDPPIDSWTKPFSNLAKECGLSENLFTAFNLISSYYSSLS